MTTLDVLIHLGEVTSVVLKCLHRHGRVSEGGSEGKGDRMTKLDYVCQTSCLAGVCNESLTTLEAVISLSETLLMPLELLCSHG